MYEVITPNGEANIICDVDRAWEYKMKFGYEFKRVDYEATERDRVAEQDERKWRY